VKKRLFGLFVLLLCATTFRGQGSASVIRLNSGEQIINTIIYGNADNTPLPSGVSGSHSASDFSISGNQNVYLDVNPFVDLFRIDEYSPAFNTGTVENLQNSDTLDLDGNPRFSCCAMDIGAFEFYDIQTRITRQPQNIHTLVGAMPVYLSVETEGRNLEFQWHHNTTVFPLMSDSRFPLDGEWSDTGTFFVIAHGVCCNDTSNVVRVIYDDWRLETGGNCINEESWAEFIVIPYENAALQNYMFFWSNGQTTPRITDLQSGNFRVTAMDFNGRSIDVDSMFHRFLPIQVDFSIAQPDNIMCDNGRISITVLNSDFEHDFFWEQNGEFFSESQNLNNVSFGDYKLFITRQGHYFCTFDTFHFSLACQHRMYSLYISPNDDGLNDWLYIPNIIFFPNNTVTIFNAFGEIIFQEDNYDNVNVRWYGRNRRGQLVPDGVYYYVVENDGVQTMGGWILMRTSQ